MHIGIFAKTFEGVDPKTVLDATRASGFSAAQYNMACSGLPSMPEDVPTSVPLAVAAAAASAKVAVVALSGTYNLIHPDVVERARGHARLALLAAAARPMGTRLVTLCTGTRNAADQWSDHPDNDTPEAWRDLLASMEVAVGIAEAHDIDLGIEPELANVINSAAKARQLIDEIGSARLKIVLDPANLFETESLERQREIVSAAIDLLADRIAMGHAKDRTAAGGFTAAGKGVLDYPHYLGCLKEIGFDGPLVAHGLSAAEAPAVAHFLGNALDALGIKVDR